MQMIGIIAAQALLNFGDPSGYILFIIPSVLVSLAFTPILLSISPAPAFGATKALSFQRLYKASPLGCVGDVPAGRRVFGAVRHGLGLGHAGGADGARDLDLRGDRSMSAGWSANIRSAGCRTGWTGAS